MMKFIVLGTKFSHLAVSTQPQISRTSLYQMAISVRCHAVQDVITKSNEIGSKDQWDQVQRFAGGLLPRFDWPFTVLIWILLMWKRNTSFSLPICIISNCIIIADYPFEMWIPRCPLLIIIGRKASCHLHCCQKSCEKKMLRKACKVR